MKPLDEQDPWSDAETRYLPGQTVQGKVARVVPFAVFVELEPGLEGVLYAFELGPGAAVLAGFARGQELQLYVKSVDVPKKRLELSMHNSPLPGLVGESDLPPAVRPAEIPQPLPTPRPFASAELPESRCPTCLHASQATWKYCVYCGGSLLHLCPHCGSVQPDLPGARYCWACGQLV